MKRRISVALAFALLASCRSERDAMDYANALLQALRQYQAEVENKVKAEQAAYRSLSGTYSIAKRDDLNLSLQLERSERALRQSERFEAKPPRLSELHDLMLDYGRMDFEATSKLYTEEMEAKDQLLAGLEGLEADRQRIQALAQGIEDLARPKSELARLKNFQSFATGVQTEFGRLVCCDLNVQLAAAEAELTKAKTPAEKTAAEAKKKAIAEAKKTRQCAATIKCN